MVDDGAGVDVTSALSDGSRFEVEIDTSGWEEGSHKVVFRLTDMAGHTHERGFTVVRDASPPGIDPGMLGPIYDVDDDVGLSAYVADDHDIREVWVSVDGGYEDLVVLGRDGGFVYQLPSGAEALGAHQVKVRAVDEVGNEGTLDLSYSVVDATDPVLWIDTPVDGSKVGRGQVVQLSGTCTDNVGIGALTLEVGAGDPNDIVDGLDPVMDQFTHPVPTAHMELGEVLLQVRALDTSGNEVTRSVLLTIVDRTDPDLELALGPTLPRATKGKDLVVPASFSDDVGVAKVEYRVDGYAWVGVIVPMSGETVDVTVPTGPLATGDHLLEVRVTDTSGNSRVANTPFSVAPVPEDDAPTTIIIVAAAVAALVVVVLVVVLFIRPRAAKAGGSVPPTEEEASGGMDGEGIEEDGGDGVAVEDHGDAGGDADGDGA
jgi:hypothetical protein